MTTCLGYDEEGRAFRCPNEAGTPWTPLWCTECDERRKARIGHQLEEMLRTLQERRGRG